MPACISESADDEDVDLSGNSEGVAKQFSHTAEVSSEASSPSSVPTQREELAIEISQLFAHLLRNLSQHSHWQPAISAVVSHVFQAYSTSLIPPEEAAVAGRCSAVIAAVDGMGAAVFLGDFPVRPYLGCLVDSQYSEGFGKVLSINAASGSAVVLTRANSRDPNRPPQVIPLLSNKMIDQKCVFQTRNIVFFLRTPYSLDDSVCIK